MARHEPESGGKLLDGGRERERDDGHPQEAEPERRADLRIRADARRIVVGRAGDQGRAQAREVSEPTDPSATPRTPGSDGHVGSVRPNRDAAAMRPRERYGLTSVIFVPLLSPSGSWLSAGL